MFSPSSVVLGRSSPSFATAMMSRLPTTSTTPSDLDFLPRRLVVSTSMVMGDFVASRVYSIVVAPAAAPSAASMAGEAPDKLRPSSRISFLVMVAGPSNSVEDTDALPKPHGPPAGKPPPGSTRSFGVETESSVYLPSMEGGG